MLIVLTATACSSPAVPPPPPPPPPDEDTALHQDGFTDLEIGREVADLSVTDVEASFAPATFTVRPENDVCSTATSHELGLVAIFDQTTAVRAFVADADVMTPERIAVGSTVSEVEAAYGSAILSTEEAAATGSRIVVEDLQRPGEQIDAESMIYVFDIDSTSTVTGIRAGQMPWLLGCEDAVPTPTPTPTPPEPEPVPADLVATFYGVGTLQLGSTVEEAEDALGVDFGPVEPLNGAGNCGLAQESTDGLAVVVATPGGVQAVVVARPDIPFVQATETPVGVGSTVDEVRAAFPQFVGSDDYTSMAGGERVVVAPAQLPGMALLMEASPDGVVQQYRVGARDYALQVEYCTTPG